MTFRLVGCSGDPKLTGPGLAVEAGMALQIASPGANPGANPGNAAAVAPSFFYLLGDLAYTTSGSSMTGSLWNTQFYTQYAKYTDNSGPLPILRSPAITMATRERRPTRRSATSCQTCAGPLSDSFTLDLATHLLL